jgi:dTDP-4-dehydrorhamnose reductase
LQRSFADFGEVVPRDRSTLDLTKPEQVRTILRRDAPDVILNAAAYTAVDHAESEPEAARSINAIAPGILAEEAVRLEALLIHYSTDYVFDGRKRTPWLETDLPNPVNVYGATKLEGERAIEQIGGKYLILRTSWVYGPRGKNFLLTMLRLGKERDHLSIVDDQIGTPTTSCELAEGTRAIVSKILNDNRSASTTPWAGLYHMTCSGVVSWHGFARAIFARANTLLGVKVPELDPISTSAYPTPAARPLYSVLSNDNLNRRFGIRLRSWESALDRVMEQLYLDRRLH